MNCISFDAGDRCPICWENFQDGTVCGIPSACKHLHCYSCIGEHRLLNCGRCNQAFIEFTLVLGKETIEITESATEAATESTTTEAATEAGEAAEEEAVKGMHVAAIAVAGMAIAACCYFW